MSAIKRTSSREVQFADWKPSLKDAAGFICPECPVYYPTSEEFSDPIQYISSIRPQAEMAGICKVVPPKGWVPPVCINEKKIKFKTKVQSLNALEGNARVSHQFMEKLRIFLYKKGKPMINLPSIEDRLVDICKLYHAVVAHGGFVKVCEDRKWPSVAASLGLKWAGKGRNLKTVYSEYLRDFELERKKDQVASNTAKKERKGETLDDCVDPASFSMVELNPSLAGPENLAADPARNSFVPAPVVAVGQKFYKHFPGQGTLLGVVNRITKTRPFYAHVSYDNGAFYDVKDEAISISSMQIVLANGSCPESAERACNSTICQRCSRSDCWDRLLLCDSCNGGYHTFCLFEPLKVVPEGDWFCSDCLNHREEDEAFRFGFEAGSIYSLSEFKKKADLWKKELLGSRSVSETELEKIYWGVLETPEYMQRLQVEYGSDLDTGVIGSGFPRSGSESSVLRTLKARKKDGAMSDIFKGRPSADEFENDLVRWTERYTSDKWNLNNLPTADGSLLKYLSTDVTGVNVPWMYIGMMFASFCWHAEDHNLFSISYNHFGEPKTWYGVPGSMADKFEETMKELSPDLFVSQPDLHLQLVTMFNPKELLKRKVPVYRSTHRPNEFMITFPSAYHSGYNNGFNCAEAVNFATIDWIPWGLKTVTKYQMYHKNPIFSHDSLMCSVAKTIAEMNDCDVHAASIVAPELLKTLLQFQTEAKDFGICSVERMEDSKHGHCTAEIGPFVKKRKTGRMAVRIRTPENSKAKKTSSRASSKYGMKTKMMSRMHDTVAWAGTSSDGLRCFRCKQYCFLGAVGCQRCRGIIGCQAHFRGMCECNPSESYVFYFRYTLEELQYIYKRVLDRTTAVETWEDCFQRYFTAEERGWNAADPAATSLSFTQLKAFAQRGKLLPVKASHVACVEAEVSRIQEWVVSVHKALPKRHSKRSRSNREDPLVSFTLLKSLFAEAITFRTLPKDVFSTLHDIIKQAKCLQQRYNSLKIPTTGSIHESECSIQKIDELLKDIQDLGVAIPEFMLLEMHASVLRWTTRANLLLGTFSDASDSSLCHNVPFSVHAIEVLLHEADLLGIPEEFPEYIMLKSQIKRNDSGQVRLNKKMFQAMEKKLDVLGDMTNMIQRSCKLRNKAV